MQEISIQSLQQAFEITKAKAKEIWFILSSDKNNHDKLCEISRLLGLRVRELADDDGIPILYYMDTGHANVVTIIYDLQRNTMHIRCLRDQLGNNNPITMDDDHPMVMIHWSNGCFLAIQADNLKEFQELYGSPAYIEYIDVDGSEIKFTPTRKKPSED